jgi:hypothetical protein
VFGAAKLVIALATPRSSRIEPMHDRIARDYDLRAYLGVEDRENGTQTVHAEPVDQRNAQSKNPA